MIIEACVETLEEALIAEKGGVDQIELCARLDLDGTTPEGSLVMACLEQLQIPVKVMIRPRGGNFVYTADEVQEMHDSIQAYQIRGAKYFVIGMATTDNRLHIDQIKQVCNAFPDARFTLHKVIDRVQDPLSAIPKLNGIPNLQSILTSGGARTAMQGADQIIAMRTALAPGKEIIAAGKITAENLTAVQERIPVGFYHGRRIVSTLMDRLA